MPLILEERSAWTLSAGILSLIRGGLIALTVAHPRPGTIFKATLRGESKERHNDVQGRYQFDSLRRPTGGDLVPVVRPLSEVRELSNATCKRDQSCLILQSDRNEGKFCLYGAFTLYSNPSVRIECMKTTYEKSSCMPIITVLEISDKMNHLTLCRFPTTFRGNGRSHCIDSYYIFYDSYSSFLNTMTSDEYRINWFIRCALTTRCTDL